MDSLMKKRISRKTKDYAILRELDKNFRESFSKIGKKVKLSKKRL